MYMYRGMGPLEHELALLQPLQELVLAPDVVRVLLQRGVR